MTRGFHPCVLAVLLLAASWAGCGQSGSETPFTDGGDASGAGQASPGSTASKQTPVERDERSPQQVVTDFLQFSKQGDNEQAELLMSDKAREITAQENLSLQPPQTETAKFEVTKAEIIPRTKKTEDGQEVELPGQARGAHVMSTWTDVAGGRKISMDMIWVLRDEPEGWRIVGAIVKPFVDMHPFAFDFEDLDHLRKTRHFIESRQQQMVQQAASAAAAAKHQAAQQNVGPSSRQGKKTDSPAARTAAVPGKQDVKQK